MTRSPIADLVPQPIRNAYPEITKEAFSVLKSDMRFLQNVLPVCEECFLYQSRLNQASGSQSLVKLRLLRDEVVLKGLGRLKPDIIKIRRDDTMDRIKSDEFRLLGKLNNKKLDPDTLRITRGSLNSLGTKKEAQADPPVKEAQSQMVLRNIYMVVAVDEGSLAKNQQGLAGVLEGGEGDAVHASDAARGGPDRGRLEGQLHGHQRHRLGLQTEGESVGKKQGRVSFAEQFGVFGASGRVRDGEREEEEGRDRGQDGYGGNVALRDLGLEEWARKYQQEKENECNSRTLHDVF